MDVIELPLAQIIPYARNPRRVESAVATVAASIREFGWRQPIVVDEAMVILAGHSRLAAAQQLGLKMAPVHVAKGLSESQARPFGSWITARAKTPNGRMIFWGWNSVICSRPIMILA